MHKINSVEKRMGNHKEETFSFELEIYAEICYGKKDKKGHSGKKRILIQ